MHDLLLQGRLGLLQLHHFGFQLVNQALVVLLQILAFIFFLDPAFTCHRFYALLQKRLDHLPNRFQLA